MIKGFAEGIVLTSLMLAFPAYGEAGNSPDPMAKFNTSYDRGVSPTGEPVVTVDRDPLWDNADMVNAAPDIEVFGNRQLEAGQLQIANGTAVLVTGDLQTMFDRINSNPMFQQFYDRVRQSGVSRVDEDYGHEGDLGDLEISADELADILLN